MSLPAKAQVVEPRVGLQQDGVYYNNNNGAWGLWGLVGLVGLFGLAGRGSSRNAERNAAATYRDPNRY